MFHERLYHSLVSIRANIICATIWLAVSSPASAQLTGVQAPQMWSDSQILDRVKLQDATVLAAIDERSRESVGDPAFAQLMGNALRQHAGGVELVPGQPGFPRGMKKGMYKNGNHPTPPGGASLNPRPDKPLWKGKRALTSLEAMIGESILCYSPQAAQAIRQSPTLQQAQGTSEQPDYPPGYSPEEMTSGSQASPAIDPSQPAYPGADPSMTESLDGYPDGTYPGNGYQGQTPGMQGGAGGPEVVKEKFTDEQFYETVIRALAANNTDAGWKVISQLADGRIPATIDDGSRDGLLLRHIAAAPAVDSDEAREAASVLVAAAKEQAFDSPNWKLISELAAATTDELLSLRMPTQEEEAPGNRPQRGQSEQYDGMEEYDFYDGGVGGAAAKASEAVTRPKVSRAGATLLSQVLWTDEFSRHVAGVLDENGNGTPLEFVALASALPLDSVRHSVYKLFASIHTDGAGGMIAGGLFTQYASDPGILPVLKTLPRQRPTRDGPDPSNPVESWNEAVLQVITQLRTRLRSVESLPQLRYADRQMVPLHDRDAVPDVSIAIDVPGESTEGGRSGSTKVYYTRVTVYDRQDKPYALRDAMAHYKKRSNGFERPQEASRTMWYDGFRKGSDGTRTSIDILVQEGAVGATAFGGQSGYEASSQPIAAAPTPAPAAGGLSGGLSGGLTGGAPAAPRPAAIGGPGGAVSQGKPYTVDIIVVTIKDPKEPPAAKVASGK